MIGRIRGTLIENTPAPHICVDVHGIGYDIDVPMSTFYNLPTLGQEVNLYTHLAIREDAHTLYGFSSHAERDMFRTLIKVSGIGLKTALGILSSIQCEELIIAVSEQNEALLCKIPGIGKKTAQRLLLELKDRLSLDDIPVATRSHTHTEINQALSALGYSPKEIQIVLKKLDPDVELQAGIRQALQLLTR